MAFNEGEKSNHGSEGRVWLLVKLSLVSLISALLVADVARSVLNGSGGEAPEPTGYSFSPFDGSREFVVLYRDPVDLSASLRRERDRGVRVENRFPNLNGAVIEAKSDDIRRLLSDSRVLNLEPNARMRKAVSTRSLRGATSWGLDRIDQRDLPLNGQVNTPNDGAGVNIYIVDTGIRSDHVEFEDRIRPGFSSIADGNGWEDCDGHGTHVAGTAAGETYGVAPQADVTAVRVLNCGGSGTIGTVLAGVDWMIEDHLERGGAAVANASLGGNFSETINNAVQRAVDAGITSVVAAGNESDDACRYSPSSAPAAVTVGSTGSFGYYGYGEFAEDQMSWFSNYGECVDLFAPGESITSAWYEADNDSKTIGGTSMAAPHVAGIAAILLSNSPSGGPSAISERLIDSATPGRITDIRDCETPNLLSYVGSGPDLPPSPTNRPANDDFSAREVLTSLGIREGSSACATAERGEPSHVTGSPAASSVWFEWSAPADGSLTLTTAGSGFDTVLAVYSGSQLSSLNRLASDNNSGPGATSRVSLDVSTGVRYLAVIDGYRGRQGEYRLSGLFEADSPGPVFPEPPTGPVFPNPTPPATPPQDVKAVIGISKVDGPAKVKMGREVKFKVSVTNSGNAPATGVRITVTGKKVGGSRMLGTVPAGKRVTSPLLKMKFKRLGKMKLSFKVSYAEGSPATVRKNIRVIR